MRKTLSVCIVVKNESRQILDCFENITVLADEIILVDTGSIDNTPNIVKNWAVRKNATKSVKVIEVGNRFHDEDGDFDFGSAKTFAFSCATKDYVMWLDASDRVQEQILLKKKFIEFSKDKDIIITLPTKMSNLHTFNRLRIAPRIKSKMIGKIHEFMYVDDMDKLCKLHINIPILNNKVKRDLDRNLRILEKEWNTHKNSRYAFYIANTLYGLKRYFDAYVWFKKRIDEFKEFDESSEEYYKSLECLCDIILNVYKSKDAQKNGITLDCGLKFSNEMIKISPKRYEGYYYLGLFYMEMRDFDNALINLKKFSECKIPLNVKLWLDPMIYKNKIYLRKIEDCKWAKKLEKPLIPDEILDFNDFFSF